MIILNAKYYQSTKNEKSIFDFTFGGSSHRRR
nr:MAG TPA: hypothetical protein [Caudoviricetes sp.]